MELNVADYVRPDPNGSYTIRQVILLTHRFFPQRFATRDGEDVRITHIEMSKVRHHEYPSFSAIGKQEPGEVKEYTRIVTYLEPKYKKRVVNGSTRIFGRKVTKAYQIIFETDKLSLDTKHWKIRLGTGKIWRKVNGNRVLAVSARDRKLNPNHDKLMKSKALRSNSFVNEGDWNSLALGLNADFIFRCSFIYKKYGHLYGTTMGLPNMRAPVKTNPRGIMFFPKHILNFFDILTQLDVFDQKD